MFYKSRIQNVASDYARRSLRMLHFGYLIGLPMAPTRVTSQLWFLQPALSDCKCSSRDAHGYLTATPSSRIIALDHLKLSMGDGFPMRMYASLHFQTKFPPHAQKRVRVALDKRCFFFLRKPHYYPLEQVG